MSHKPALDLMVLCGGRGVRLRPTTDQVPKALVPVKGRPIIDYVVDFFASKGLRQATLCIGYKGEKLRQHFAGPRNGMSFAFSDCGEEASMLKRLYEASRQAGPEFLVAYGDTFVDLDLDAMHALHRRKDALATLLTSKVQSPLGFVNIGPDHTITRFQEKPVLDYFVGMFLVSREAFDLATPEMLEMPDGQGLVHLFNMLVERERLAAFEHDGLKITFNTHAERDEAESILSRFYTLEEQ